MRLWKKLFGRSSPLESGSSAAKEPILASSDQDAEASKHLDLNASPNPALQSSEPEKVVVETLGGHKIAGAGKCVVCGCSSTAIRRFDLHCEGEPPKKIEQAPAPPRKSKPAKPSPKLAKSGEESRNAAEISEIGQAVLMFCTQGEKDEWYSQQIGDALLAKITQSFLGMDTENDTAFKKRVLKKFMKELEDDGASVDSVSENELYSLIDAYVWLVREAHLGTIPFHVSGMPLFFGVRDKLIVPEDNRFRARIRMALAAVNVAGRSVSLVDYVGYLKAQW